MERIIMCRMATKLIEADYSKCDILIKLVSVLEKIIDDNTIVLCIGSDRVIADSIGPLVGTILTETNFELPTYGVLGDTLDALSLRSKLKEIKQKHPYSKVIALDASMGRASQIGLIQIFEGPCKPGAAFNKKLPEVGDYTMKVVVAHDEHSFNHVDLEFIKGLAEPIALSFKLSV